MEDTLEASSSGRVLTSGAGPVEVMEADRLGAFIALGMWLDQFVPGISPGRRSPLGYVFALVFIALLSFRGVRNLIFYTADVPEGGAANKDGSTAQAAAATDLPRDNASPESQ